MMREKLITILTNAFPIYCVCAWGCIAGSCMFSMSERFMDPVLYPKWIITAIVVLFFTFFSLPLIQFTIAISWRLIYKQICRCTYILVFVEALFAATHFFFEYDIYTYCAAGSFNNTAGLAACLAISFPMGFMFLEEYKVIEKVIFGLSKLISLIVLVFYGSRIGCISIIVTIILVFSRNKYKKYLASIFCCVAFILCACFIKTPSTMGRWFILKRTSELIMKHPWLGWGAGGFSKEYMNVQAEYFSTHPESPSGMLADNIHHPLNEFFLIATNYGIIVTIMIISCSIMLYLYYTSHKTECGKEGCLILTSILLLASFSYPFSYPYSWLLLLLSILLILSKEIIRLFKKGNILVLTVSIIIACFIAFIPLKRELEFQLAWKKVSQHAQATTIDEILDKYETLYIEGNRNCSFLYDYACMAYDKEKYTLALKLSEEAEQLISDYELKMLIADCHQLLHNKDEALDAYRTASNMCPSKIMPLYEIYKIYSCSNDTVNCRRIYAEITNKNIKVQSRIIDIILNKINQDIKRFY